MDTEYSFRELIQEHSERTGFEMPELLEQYLALLLESRLTEVTIVPEPSFAECFLELNNRSNKIGLKHFGDQCLFFSSLLPEWGHRRGLTPRYYAQLGSSSYEGYSHWSGDLRFRQLAMWFEPLQRFLASMVQHGQGREIRDLYLFELNKGSGFKQ